MGMGDDWVRLGMALVIIALVSVGMYHFGGRSGGMGQASSGHIFRP